MGFMVHDAIRAIPLPPLPAPHFGCLVANTPTQRPTAGHQLQATIQTQLLPNAERNHHRMAWVEKDLRDHLVSAPMLQAGLQPTRSSTI